MTAVSGVVIAIPSHAPFIPLVLDDIERQTEPLDELILILSGEFSDFAMESISRRLKAINPAAKIVSFPRIQSAGINRNAGLEAATSEYVMFFDADDRYSRDRVARVKEVAGLGPFSLLLHHAVLSDSSTPFESRTTMLSEGPALLRWSSGDIKRSTFPHGNRDRLRELGGGESSLVCPDKCPAGSVLHHGHAVVGKQNAGSSLRFHRRFWPRNEDSIFARDAVWRGHNVIILNESLSSYVTSTSTGGQTPPSRELFSRFLFLSIIAAIRLLRLLFRPKVGKK